MRCCVLIGILPIALGSVGLTEELPRKVKPVVVWTGIDSLQPKELFARCCSEKEWQKIWRAHYGPGKGLIPPDCPEIDFDSYTVIALFQESSRIRLVEVLEEDTLVRLRYQPYGGSSGIFVDPKTDALKLVEVGRGEIDPNKPYLLSFAFIVLPRTNKSLVIEQDVRSHRAEPAVWKERKKFERTVQK